MQNLALVLAVAVMTGWCAGMIYPAAIGFRGQARVKVCMWGFCATLLAVTLARLAPNESTWDISDTTAGLLILPILFGWPIWATFMLVRDVFVFRRSSSTEAVSDAPAGPVTAPLPSGPTSIRTAEAPDPHRPSDFTVPGTSRKKQPGRATKAARTRSTVCFEYIDANGDWSMRTVTVNSVSSSRIQGVCHLRHAERTFLLERIEGDIVDLETGEVFAPANWARQYA